MLVPRPRVKRSTDYFSLPTEPSPDSPGLSHVSVLEGAATVRDLFACWQTHSLTLAAHYVRKSCGSYHGPVRWFDGIGGHFYYAACLDGRGVGDSCGRAAFALGRGPGAWVATGEGVGACVSAVCLACLSPRSSGSPS